jgi:hypothetical protein
VVDLCSYGVSGAWIGYHADIVGLDEAREASRDISGDPENADPNAPDLPIVGEALSGDTEAKRGQDHRAVAENLRDAAAQIPPGTSMETMAALHARAQSHDAMGAKEAKATAGDPRVIQRNIWIQRGIIGFDTFWHPAVHDFQHSPWVTRRALVPLDVFKKWDEIAPEYRKKAVGSADRYRPSVTTSGNTSSTAREAQDKSDPSEKYVECYEFWIKEPWRPDGGRRKIASPEFKGEWIESNEANPFIDKRGRPLIRGFFPFFYCAPTLPPLEDPRRTLGVALVEPGAKTEERINEFLSTILAHYKRHGFRVYALHPLLKHKPKIREALRRGTDGFAFDAPEGVKDAKEMQGLIVPIQFSGQAEQMERMLGKLIEFWRIEQGFPAAALMGVAQSDTATQESIGVEAGQNELGVISARIEEWAAALTRGVLGLMRGFYGVEKMRELLGQQGAQAWDLYRETSMEGDRITVALGARAARSEAVNIEQTIKAINVIRTYVDPLSGVRLLDEFPQIEELLRGLKSGAPKKLPEAVVLAQQFLAQVQQQMAAEQAAAQGGTGAPSRNGKAPQSSEGDAPTEANLNSAARRGTVPV